MPEANHQVTSDSAQCSTIKKTALCFFGGGLRATSGAAAAVSVGVALKHISDSMDESEDSDSELVKFQESDIGALIR